MLSLSCATTSLCVERRYGHGVSVLTSTNTSGVVCSLYAAHMSSEFMLASKSGGGISDVNVCVGIKSPTHNDMRCISKKIAIHKHDVGVAALEVISKCRGTASNLR